MASISSLIVNKDHAESPDTRDNLKPIINLSNNAELENSIEPRQATPISEDLLSEIQAIQDAMINNESFDFASLEAPAAGPDNLTMANDKSVSSTPILLNDDPLIIQYRGTSTVEVASDLNNQISNSTLEAIGDSSFLSSTNEPNITPIQTNVSEDFITSTRGSFEADTLISPQTIDTTYGSLTCNEDGTWVYTLNNKQSEIQSLSAGSSLQDTINLTSITGEPVVLAVNINGSNDQAIITGQKQAQLEAIKVSESSNTQATVSGKLNVADIDNGEAGFIVNTELKGSFGLANIDALGKWEYSLNNNSDAVQSLRAGDTLFDLFSVKTLDGSKQLIQISIQGVNDAPILTGKNSAILDLETDINTLGSLTISDPDFGESSFQALTNIQSSLGYGTAEIDTQGNWSFELNNEFTSSNPIGSGQTQYDSFEVFTADGTSQTIIIPIQGSDSPLYARSNINTEPASLALEDVLSDQQENQLASNDLATLLTTQNLTQDSPLSPLNSHSEQAETSLYMNGDTSPLTSLSQNLNDITIS